MTSNLLLSLITFCKEVMRTIRLYQKALASPTDLLQAIEVLCQEVTLRHQTLGQGRMGCAGPDLVLCFGTEVLRTIQFYREGIASASEVIDALLELCHDVIERHALSGCSRISQVPLMVWPRFEISDTAWPESLLN